MTPSEAGYYWVFIDKEWRIVEVISFPSGLQVWETGNDTEYPMSEYADYEFRGPIPEPILENAKVEG